MDLNEQIKLVSQLFEQTYTQPQNIAQVEKQLFSMSQLNANFIELVAAVIISPNNDQNMKQAATLYLKTYIKQQCTSDQIYDKTKKFYHASTIVHALKHDLISNKLKSNLIEPLTQIIDMDYENSVKISLCPEIIKNINADSRSEIYGALFAIQAILGSVTQSQALRQFFAEVIKSLNQMSSKLVLLIQKNFQDYKVNQNPTFINEVENNLDLLLSWAVTIKRFVKKFAQMKKYFLLSITQDNQLVQIMVQTLGLILNDSNQIQNCLISTSSNQKINKLLNQIKEKVLHSYNKTIGFIFDSQDNQQNESHFYLLLDKLIPVVIQTLIQFCSHEKVDIEAATCDQQVENCLVQSLIFLAKCGEQQAFYHLFEPYKYPLIIHVVFPLLSTTKNEIEIFNQTPDDFVTLALDTCDKQISETFKTSSAQLLEIICDHIDGALSFCGIIACQVINYSLKSNKLEDIPNQFPQLQNLVTSKFMTVISQEVRIDTCLMMISILSYIIPKREDLIQQIEQCLLINMDFFTHPQCSQLIRARFCLFLGYYGENIFKEQHQAQFYNMYIKFLVNTLNNRDQQAVFLQAIDSLKNIFEDTDIQPRMQQIFSEVFTVFTQLIETVDNNQFYDLLESLVQIYASQLSYNDQLLLSFIDKMVNRVIQELQMLGKKNQTNNIIINKIWNIIRTFGEKEYYSVHVTNLIEQNLVRLYQFLENPEKIEFDEDIVLITANFIRKNKSISIIQQQIFPYLSKVFDKSQKMFGNLFKTLNLYLIYGKQFFESNKTNLDLVILMGLEAMFANANITNEANHSEGALILQLVIQYYSSLLSVQHLEEIYKKSIEKLQKDIKHDFLKAKIHGIFLSGFVFAPLPTLQILAPNQQYFAIIDLILNQHEVNQTEYDRKVIVIGLGALLIAQDQPQELQNQMTKILDIMVTHLNNQTQNKVKKQPKKNHDSDEDDELDDEMYDDSDDDMFDSDEDEMKIDKHDINFDAKTALDQLESYVKSLDEFEEFKSIIKTVKERNQQMLLNSFNNLNPEKQNYLKQVLNNQRIVIDDAEGTTVTRKIVKVRAKKQL